MTIEYKGREYRKGDVAKVAVDGVNFVAIINIENENFFICHNISDFSGTPCKKKFGMHYSYTFNYTGKKKVSLTEKVVLKDIVGKCKSHFFLAKGLLDILDVYNIPNYLFCDTIYKDYNKFDVSNKSGMVKLTNTITKKQTDIKFGRFINIYSQEISKVFDFEALNSKQIEKLHNLFLMYQADEHITIEELSGDNIYKAYESENYSKMSYTLASSCMTNKSHILSLYAKNPKNVKLMVVKNFDKIAGRCLIWTTDCGKTIMDKRYVADDWVYEKFDSIRRDKGMIDYERIKKNYKVTVNVDGITEYPYLDTFMYLTDPRTLRFVPKFMRDMYKTFLPIPKKKVLSIEKPIRRETLRLRSTIGGYDLLN